MAIVRVPQLGRSFIMPAEIEMYLASIGVEYQRWTRVKAIPSSHSATEILKAYEPELENYRVSKKFLGYDVVDLTPETPRLEEMLRDFRREHWHNNYESHFVVAGRGVCNIHATGHPVAMVELEPGDLISIGCGVRHWFDLCAERRFRAIRFVSEDEDRMVGYTGSGIEADYEPVCMGLTYFPLKAVRPMRETSHSF